MKTFKSTMQKTRVLDLDSQIDVFNREYRGLSIQEKLEILRCSGTVERIGNATNAVDFYLFESFVGLRSVFWLREDTVLVSLSEEVSDSRKIEG